MAILNNSNAISSGGYDINNSLRFRASNSASLSRTFGTPTSGQKWTMSFWVKRGALAAGQLFAKGNTSTSPWTLFYFGSNDTLNFYEYNTGGTGSNFNLSTNAVFRDPSAWYHIVVAVDTTLATAANRQIVYVNGVSQTFSSASYYPQNTVTTWNSSGGTSYIFQQGAGPTTYLDGYLAETHFVDGQQLTPSSFGSTNSTTGVWQPAKYTGTYGNNGFYLNFNSIALTSGSNTGLGKDNSGNGNYWNTNNISVTAGTTYDAMTDVPTNTSATVANFPVLSPLNYRTYSGSVTPTISNANLTVTQASTVASCIGTATMGATASGKYYWEATFVSGSGSRNSFLGVVAGQLQNTTAADLGYYSNEYSYQSGNGNKINNNTGATYGSSYTSGDVIGIALDLDAGTLTFYKNNTSQGVAFSSLSASETYFPAFDTYYNNTFAYNFGQRPFAYTPPSGHIAINTYNLPTPTILQGNKYMDATLWTGAGASTMTITNTAGFKPDMVWVKSRSNAYSNLVWNSIVGVGNTTMLVTNTTDAEGSYYGNANLTSFNSNGFSTGATSGTNVLNANGVTNVAWQWQAGQGSSTSNTSGSITSTVSVNTTAGFSVVTYVGNATAGASVGHGLGVAPSLIITKNRDSATAWWTYHKSLGATQYVVLNTTAAAVTSSSAWNNTSPTSTVFYLGAASPSNANQDVAYCWAEIAGFSKFGSYTGNGSADGPFVYLGFRPKFIITKITTSADEWITLDSARSDVANANTNDQVLNPYSSAAESSGSSYGNPLAVDFLSNGFKIRGTQNANNNSGSTFIYMAFAANPFKNSNAF